MRHFIAACLVALATVIAPLTASAATTPDVYSADKIATGRQAFVVEQVAALNAKKVSDAPSALMLLIAVNPDNTSYVTSLSEYAGKASDYSFLAGLLAIQPNNAMAAWSMAEKLSGAGFHTLALPYHRIASDAYPTSYSTQNKAGLNAYFAGDYAACVMYFDRSSHIDHPYAFGGDEYARQGECYAFLGDPEQAASKFGAAISRDPSIANTFAARMVKDKVFAGCKGSAASRTEAAATAFARGKAYEAYRDVHIALQCDRLYIPALELRVKIEEADFALRGHANAHRKLLDNIRDGGQTDARDGADLKPRTPAQLISEADKIDMALSPRNIAMVAYLARQALMQDPANWRANLFLARALANRGDKRLYPMSWQALERADVASGPLDIDRASIHNVRGLLYFRAGLNTEALAEYNAAITLTPNDLRFYAMRGAILIKLAELDKARADLDFVLRFDPKNVAALTYRVALNYEQKAWAAARADLERLYALEPGNDQVRGEIIRVLDLEGKTAEANARHRQFLIDDEAGAEAIAYLAGRATPAMRADAAAAREKAMNDANRKAVDVKLRAISDSYAGAEGAMSDSRQYVEQQLARGGTQGSDEVVRLIDDAIKKYRDTMTLILDLKGSDKARYLRPDEITSLDNMYKDCGLWVDQLLESRKRFRWN